MGGLSWITRVGLVSSQAPGKRDTGAVTRSGGQTTGPQTKDAGGLQEEDSPGEPPGGGIPADT